MACSLAPGRAFLLTPREYFVLTGRSRPPRGSRLPRCERRERRPGKCGSFLPPTWTPGPSPQKAAPVESQSFGRVVILTGWRVYFSVLLEGVGKGRRLLGSLSWDKGPLLGDVSGKGRAFSDETDGVEGWKAPSVRDKWRMRCFTPN